MHCSVIISRLDHCRCIQTSLNPPRELKIEMTNKLLFIFSIYSPLFLYICLQISCTLLSLSFSLCRLWLFSLLFSLSKILSHYSHHVTPPPLLLNRCTDTYSSAHLFLMPALFNLPHSHILRLIQWNWVQMP